MGKYTGKPYQPSNGTEGMWFMEEYCMNCLHCDPDPNGRKQCEVMCAAMCYNIDEPKYPKEWVYDENDHASCSKWQKWDWSNDGDPDDRDNPKAPIPENPNQLCLPFIFDEIGIKVNEVLSNI